MCFIIMSDIKNKASEIDSEKIYENLVKKVNNKEFDSFIEAFVSYIEEYDLDLTTIKKYVSPSLKNILFKEACNKNMIINPPISNIPEELFGD